MKRRMISRSGSRRLFSKTARKVNKRNALIRPMRGGIRL